MAGTWTEIWDPDRGWVKVYISLPNQECLGLGTPVSKTVEVSLILGADGQPIPKPVTGRIGFVISED